MRKAIWQTALTDVKSSDIEGVGSIREERGKTYKWVKIRNTTATVAGVAGDAAAYDAEDGVVNGHVVLDLTDADNPPVPAGILCGTVTGTLATSYYGWIQVTGPCTVNQTLGGSAGDGHPLYIAATDKTLTKAVEADSAGVYKTVCAIANDASAKTIICMFPF